MSETKDLDCFTVKQARNMCCPKAFIVHDAGGPNHSEEFGVCAADRCMAWRWSQADKTKAFSRRVIEVAKADNTDWGKAHQKVLKEESDNFTRTEGYCGLAGYPHNSLRP